MKEQKLNQSVLVIMASACLFLCGCGHFGFQHTFQSGDNVKFKVNGQEGMVILADGAFSDVEVRLKNLQIVWASEVELVKADAEKP